MAWKIMTLPQVTAEKIVTLPFSKHKKSWPSPYYLQPSLPDNFWPLPKFQNILTSASWFHAWTPALKSQTKNVMEIICWFQKSNVGDLELTEQSTAKLQGCQEKSKVRKSENLFE